MMRAGLVSAVAAVAPSAAWAEMGYHQQGMPMMMGSGAGWIFGPLMMLGIVLVAVAVVLLLVQVLRGRPEAGARRPAGESARDILDKRFARGEIDAEEYDRRRQLLEQ